MTHLVSWDSSADHPPTRGDQLTRAPPAMLQSFGSYWQPSSFGRECAAARASAQSAASSESAAGLLTYGVRGAERPPCPGDWCPFSIAFACDLLGVVYRRTP